MTGPQPGISRGFKPNHSHSAQHWGTHASVLFAWVVKSFLDSKKHCLKTERTPSPLIGLTGGSFWKHANTPWMCLDVLLERGRLLQCLELADLRYCRGSWETSLRCQTRALTALMTWYSIQRAQLVSVMWGCALAAHLILASLNSKATYRVMLTASKFRLGFLTTLFQNHLGLWISCLKDCKGEATMRSHCQVPSKNLTYLHKI